MAGQNPGSPTDFQYFYEDEVYKINNRGQVVFGLVLENYEANSSDQESDIETPVQKGEIRVVWHPSGTERVISEKSVGLADRSLMPGDVVRRLIAGKDTQRGYCRDIVMTAALQIVGTKHVIPSVASERLQPLEEFTPDLAVCLDSWVGTSKAVHSKLRLVSADGSRLEYPDLDTCPLEDYSMRRRRSTPYSSSEFYPGQVVYGPLGSLDNATWLSVTKEMKAARKHKMHDHKFTVEAVMTESVSVHWQCRALCTHPESGAPHQPKFLVEGDDLKKLKLLNVFEPCTLQVGDRNFLTIGPEDTFISKKQWRKQQSKYHRNLRKQSRPTKKSSKSETNSSEHVPSRPKKRASSHRKLKNTDHEMEVDTGEEKLECLDEVLKTDPNCPSIKIEPIGDVSLPMASSQEDTATEEKNDSGISGLSKSHFRSPEPTREESFKLNGDSKSEIVVANDDDSDNWENTSSDGSDTDSVCSGATWSSRCSSAASARGKRSPQLAVRLLRGKRLKRTPRRAPPAPPPRRSDRVVVETLHTASRANVVWQDGTIEMGIPSTQLYPIHHLDGQECFPGDFVVSGAANVEENQQPPEEQLAYEMLKHREYGVVQRVDHHGRTAIVHWYRTYTSTDDPVPQMLHESEVSVYDLKDHPDFQYRPGTVVIRVANFTGEDEKCTAGQVIDNYPTGRVKVWWVDGHTSMCWPQDLYKVQVGEYDSEEGELWGSDGSGSEDSWETQSSAHEPDTRSPDCVLASLPAHTTLYVNTEAQQAAGGEAIDVGSEKTIKVNVTVEDVDVDVAAAGGPIPVPRLLEPRVAAHIERGRVAMRRLEEMFARHPALQSQEIMRKLLNLYKDCRFLDRLMGTSFFHEDHFLGLLERVRERGASTPRAGERRVHEQLARLFAHEPEDHEDPPAPPGRALIHSNLTVEPMEIEGDNSKKLFADAAEPAQASGSDVPSMQDMPIDNLSTDTNDVDGATRNVCYKLCSLIHTQLVKAHAEVSRRRPQELAEFLNNLMKQKDASEENLLYHFSVQYGALVVNMGDEDEKEEPKPMPEDADVKDATTTTIVAKTDGDNGQAVTEAPLASVEGMEAEVADTGPDEIAGEGFSLLEFAPAAHRFRMSMLQPSDPRSFYSAVKREIKLLKSDLPPGVWVRGYENRIDLLSVMIAGPTKTPYEDGLFVFDVQLGGEYPRAPPLCHYHSYCSDRLNPNLYEDGKVCVSLLGTWSGRGVEVWGKDSSLLQVIVSLQGLILNSEPYFNEAGYEKQKGTQQGNENSRMYNEMVLLKLVQSMTKMVLNPPEPFRREIVQHLRAHAAALCRRLEGLVALSRGEPAPGAALPAPPDYPLVPASRGFCLTLRSSLDAFRAALRRNDIHVPPSTL
ncbi:(E3-independent) E2 ubiquitin-conjugating enzyme isoform X3 [Manduca sexta]|uniref:(E3-independent) E2 ubiquitin-conjugating enzyme isoform X3 n=1 Tax=Manduca sexta TaxID=7130 RepID=UPI00188F31A8|nr:(E3-independent) E2 ubiquitin-conjugating enzyme isoform X3 [Manduca sexta]